MKRARWLLTYEGVDVTDELWPFVTQIDYSDHIEGESDELNVELQDVQGRWRAGWFPQPSSALALQFGWGSETLLDAGTFRVDTVDAGFGPDTVSIRALAVPITSDLRTVRSQKFEATTLRAIVQSIADALGLSVLGEVPDLLVQVAVQNNVSTLAFLRRLAADYGYAFSVRPPQLVFYSLVDLELAESALTLSRNQVAPGARFSATAQRTYAACEVRWFDPQTKELRTVTVFADYARSRVVVGGEDEGRSGEPEAPPVLPSRLLRSGVRGDDVRKWQQFLQGQGIDVGAVDGIFGPKTHNATMAFQRQGGIKVDGIAGPETFRAAVEAGYGRASEQVIAGTDVVGPLLRVDAKVETIEQAQAMAAAKLAEANRLQARASLKTVGDIRLCAGVPLELSGFGYFDGRYSIQSARHSISRSSGWTTEVEVTNIPPPPKKEKKK